MSTQYRLVQSGKTASGGCSAGQGSLEPVAPRIYLFIYLTMCEAMLPLPMQFRHVILKAK
jgi:carbohydrate-binding DOMON domain-containing protein